MIPNECLPRGTSHGNLVVIDLTAKTFKKVLRLIYLLRLRRSLGRFAA